ncbi:MAG: universal stress protein [Magnetococcus sp. WYHC-3]
MKTLLAMTDLTDNCQKVLDMAEELARGMGWTLHLMHVVPPEPGKDSPASIGNEEDSMQPRREAAASLKEKRQILHDTRDILISRGVHCVAVMVEGDLEEKLVANVEKIHPEFIIIGRHCHDALYKIMFGTRSVRLMDKIHYPFMIVPLPPKA